MTAGLEQVAPLLGRALGAWRVPVVGQLVSAAVSLTTSRICYLTLYRIYATYRISLAHRGASPETVPLAERGVASRGFRLVTFGPGRPGTPPARHYDLAARLYGSGGNAGDHKRGPRPKIATVERREARVLPLEGARRLASAWRAAQQRVLNALRHAAGAAAPERRLGAPPPLGVDEGKVQAPGAKRVAGTRRRE